MFMFGFLAGPSNIPTLIFLAWYFSNLSPTLTYSSLACLNLNIGLGDAYVNLNIGLGIGWTMLVST